MKKLSLAILALAALTAGCAFQARTVGMQDPAVEIARALAASQTATVKALTDALSAKSCAVPEVVK